MIVVDVLSYLSMRDASGLEELAPTEATRRGRSSFISSLFGKENWVGRASAKNRPNLFLVGGQLTKSQLDNWCKRGI